MASFDGLCLSEMTFAHDLRYSYEDYLRTLADSEIKLEYCAGVIYAMAGGTIAHAALGAAVVRLLGNALRGCVVMTSDAKVRVESSDFAGFPDASVVCGEVLTSRIDKDVIINPTLLVEVTSRSTEKYDRGEKLAHYRSLSSLRAVLFVSHRERRVTVVLRDAGDWTTREVGEGERVQLRDPEIDISVDEIYEGIALEAG